MPLFDLIPACKSYLWGGDTLKEKYGKQFETDVLAETWELSCHPDGESLVHRPGQKDQPLSAWLAQHPGAAGTLAAKFEAFPLLVKLIDAKQALSIQVHPSDEYALKNEGQFGKTEMWYVVEAEADAFLYYGFQKEISKDEFRQRIENNTLLEVLNAVPVKSGDAFFIEAGTIHAIGAGIVIAEVQQSSNVTYRVYDYARTGPDGKQRELHIEKACAVTNCAPAPQQFAFGGHLAQCEYFTVDKLEITDKITLSVTDESFYGLVCVSGSAIVKNGSDTTNMQPGQTVFIPADSGKVILHGHATVLGVYLSQV